MGAGFAGWIGAEGYGRGNPSHVLAPQGGRLPEPRSVAAMVNISSIAVVRKILDIDFMFR